MSDPIGRTTSDYEFSYAWYDIINQLWDQKNKGGSLRVKVIENIIRLMEDYTRDNELPIPKDDESYKPNIHTTITIDEIQQRG